MARRVTLAAPLIALPLHVALLLRIIAVFEVTDWDLRGESESVGTRTA